MMMIDIDSLAIMLVVLGRGVVADGAGPRRSYRPRRRGRSRTAASAQIADPASDEAAFIVTIRARPTISVTASCCPRERPVA